MTIQISNNNPRISYTATGGQTAFPTNFAFFNEGDINVYINDVLKTLNTNYTVSGGSGAAGTVTLTTGATAGDIIVLTRDVELERTTDFPTSGPFQVASLNVELDKLIAMMADMKDLAGRGLRLSDSDTSAALVVADKDTRKGTVLAFNETTGAIEVGPTIADTNSIAQIKADIATLADIQDGTVATNAITTVSSISSDVTTVSSNNANVTTVAGQTTNMQNITDNLTALQNAATNATTATTKASEAAASAVSASFSEAGANTSETNAATSATNATSSATAASTSASAASTSASAASTSATAAGTSETNAATSATTANTWANAAAISSLNAASSESNAASSATSAASAQTAAESARDSALAAYDNFDDRYLGVKSSDPTVDNDGDALVAGALYFNSTSQKFLVYTGSAWADAYADGTTLVSKSGDTMTGNLSFGDNDKAIFGAGTDLQIYHDGSSSFIKDVGTGNLEIWADGAVIIKTGDGSETKALFDTNGSVDLYHNNSKKLATTATGVDITGTVTAEGLTISDDYPQIIFTDTNNNPDWTLIGANGRIGFYNATNAVEVATINSTGIDVTGTVTADGLTVDGDIGFSSFAKGITLPSGTTNADILRVGYTGGVGDTLTIAPAGGSSTSNLIFKTAAGSAIKQRMRILANGDISFYEDTGTTAKLFWDASAEALQIDTDGTGFAINSSSNAYMVIDRSAANRRAELVFSTASTNVLNSPPLSATADWALGVSDSDELAGDAFYIATASGAGNAKMVITQAGSVGIGTSSPDGKLHIDGASDTVTGLVFEAGVTGDNKFIDFQNTSGAKRMGVEYDNNNVSLSIVDRSENKLLTIKEGNGNVGIGTASPSQNLHVSSSADTVVRITSADGNGAFLDLGDASDPDGGRIVYDSGSNLTFSTASTERVRIKSDGKVGIGTSSPEEKLTIAGIRNEATLRLKQLESASNWSNGDDLGAVEFSTADPSGAGSGVKGSLRYQTIGGTGAGTYMSFNVAGTTSGTNDTERMRIDSVGRLFIGGTSATASPTLDKGIFLQSTTNGDVLGYNLYANEGTNNRRASFFLDDTNGVYGFDTSASTGLCSFVVKSATSEKLRVDPSGNLLVGTTSVNPGLGNTNEGHSLNASGTAVHSADGNNALRVNRNTSDGTVITIAKDGTTAGHISTRGGGMYLGTASNAIRFTSTDIRPVNVSGVNTTNTVDLGDAAARFKDLHLGGTANAVTINTDGPTGTGNGIVMAASGWPYKGRIGMNGTSGGKQYWTANYNLNTSSVDSASYYSTYIENSAQHGIIAFGTSSAVNTAPSERARLDSSGNLLVGKTISSSATVGITLEPAGAVVATRDGGECFIANRKTSDGTIIQLRKDQTTVGSIGTQGGAATIGNGVTGLRFSAAGYVHPHNITTNTASDNTTDLGASTARFKDLHLSGTAYASNVVSQVAINAQTGTAYTTVLTDQSKLVTLTNASAIAFTIPANSSVAYPIGTQIDLSQFGAGQVTVAGPRGVTVNSASGLKLRAQYSSASCIKVATNTWLLVGDLEVS